MRSRESRSSRGFSLVEVLIIIAVLAVLMAMLLPAIQSFRASARRTDCGNNLKNLAAGIQGFHSQNGQLPPAWGAYPGYATMSNLSGKAIGTAGGGASSSAMFGSWIAHILPHIDMNAEYLRLPRAKVCLGYRRWENVPNSGQGAAFIPSDRGHQLTRDDGVNFNIHDSNWWNASFQGNTVSTAGPSSLPGNGTSTDTAGNTTAVTTNGDGTVVRTYTTVTSTITTPIYRYDTVPETVFSMNGATYTIWRTTQTITGSNTRVVPGSTSTQVLGNRNSITPDNASWTGLVGDRVGVYFNLSGSTSFGRGYPAAQETIRVPITVCKGDNSVIESSRMLPWLAGRGWSTTNYMVNPFAFNSVDRTEGLVTIRSGAPTADSPAGWGRYRVWGEGKRLDQISDGQSSTILLTEAMRYCTTLVQMTGSGAGSAPTSIDIARLAFWSSPKLVNTVDMWLPSTFDPWSYTQRYDLAIQPHTHASGTTYFSRRMSMPVPTEVSWKPWTHNFAIEWEANGSVDVMYANTFMFQSQPKPAECSSMRAQSNHGSVLMVAMCDGSVRAINGDISRREVTEADIVGKQVAGAPNMGNQGATDGTWDRLVRDNDGVMVSGY
jgi:type II secretory pathway pseudopilin PulG